MEEEEKVIEIGKDIGVRVCLYEESKEAFLSFRNLTKDYIEDTKEAHKGYKVTEMYIINFEKGTEDFICSYGRDIRFLGVFDNVFEIYRGQEIEFLKCFRNVKKIRIHPPYIKNDLGRIDFTAFKELEEAEINPYWPGAESVFKARSLKKLTIWSYPFKDFSPFKELVNLEHIELNQPSIRNFKGAPGLKKLKRVEVYYAMGLKSLDGVEHFDSLEELIIGYGKPKEISAVRNLKKLRRLVVKAQTLKPLEDHKSLQSLYLEAVEDKDISVLFKIPNLKSYTTDHEFDIKSPYSRHEINAYLEYKFKA